MSEHSLNAHSPTASLPMPTSQNLPSSPPPMLWRQDEAADAEYLYNACAAITSEDSSAQRNLASDRHYDASSETHSKSVADVEMEPLLQSRAWFKLDATTRTSLLTKAQSSYDELQKYLRILEYILRSNDEESRWELGMPLDRLHTAKLQWEQAKTLALVGMAKDYAEKMTEDDDPWDSSDSSADYSPTGTLRYFSRKVLESNAAFSSSKKQLTGYLRGDKFSETLPPAEPLMALAAVRDQWAIESLERERRLGKDAALRQCWEMIQTNRKAAVPSDGKNDDGSDEEDYLSSHEESTSLLKAPSDDGSLSEDDGYFSLASEELDSDKVAALEERLGMPSSIGDDRVHHASTQTDTVMLELRPKSKADSNTSHQQNDSKQWLQLLADDHVVGLHRQDGLDAKQIEISDEQLDSAFVPLTRHMRIEARELSAKRAEFLSLRGGGSPRKTRLGRFRRCRHRQKQRQAYPVDRNLQRVAIDGGAVSQLVNVGASSQQVPAQPSLQPIASQLLPPPAGLQNTPTSAKHSSYHDTEKSPGRISQKTKKRHWDAIAVDGETKRACRFLGSTVPRTPDHHVLYDKVVPLQRTPARNSGPREDVIGWANRPFRPMSSPWRHEKFMGTRFREDGYQEPSVRKFGKVDRPAKDWLAADLRDFEYGSRSESDNGCQGSERGTGAGKGDRPGGGGDDGDQPGWGAYGDGSDRPDGGEDGNVVVSEVTTGGEELGIDVEMRVDEEHGMNQAMEARDFLESDDEWRSEDEYSGTDQDNQEATQ